MAGGTWLSQNKILPGVYINTKSKGNLAISVGPKGIVAICKPLSFGPTGVVSEYIPGDDPTAIIGNNLLSDEALFLREMCKGSDTTPAPSKILIYRPEGTSGVAATATVGALTATAKYIGARGNDITLVIVADPDNAGYYNIITTVDGDVVDDQYVNDLDDLIANAWVTFTGTGTTITATAGTALTGGVDPTVSATDYAAFMTAIEPYTFDIVCYDGGNATIAAAHAAFAKRLSETTGRKCQAVVSNDSGANSEWAINVVNGVNLADGTAITAAQATWWLAGAEAGAPYNKSLTYAQYPGAVSANPKKTTAEIEAAVTGGNIVFIDEFETVKVCTDINTLTTFTADKGQEYSKNRVMRVLMQVCNDIYKQFSLYFIGKVDNNDTGRSLMKGWIVGYLNEMQANNGIQNFTSDDVTVEQGNAIDSVLVTIAIQPVDSIEKIYITVTVSVTAEN